MNTSSKPKMHLAIFGAKREEESFEDFEDRVVESLRAEGRIAKDGKINLAPNTSENSVSS